MAKVHKPRESLEKILLTITIDISLSHKAKGIYATMLVGNENEDFSIGRLTAISSEGYASTQSGIWELERRGYLIRNQFQKEDGTMDMEYTLNHHPVIFKNQDLPRRRISHLRINNLNRVKSGDGI